MKIYRIIIILSIIWMIICYSSLSACTLKMGYRTSKRPPLIAESPDNSGLYYELYSRAAEKIGCTVQVIRKPKKRILKDLQAGEIDFYPGFTFTQERAEFIYFIENGLSGGNIGVSRFDFPEITNLSQLKGYTLVGPVGGPDYLEGIEGVKEHRIPEMTIAHAFLFLRKGRADFLIYIKESIEYYLKQNKVTDMKIHPSCCGGLRPHYLGFSRNSPHFKEEKNPNFDASNIISVENFPTIVSPDSSASQFAQALKEMKENGETDTLYNKYYK